MFTDLVHRTDSNAVLREIRPAEHVSSLAISDVSWDAFEKVPLDNQAESSLLSFADMASNSDSGYWTDSDCVGPISLSSCGNYPAFPESLLEEGSLFAPGSESRENTKTSAQQQANPIVFNATDSSTSKEARGIMRSPQDSPALSDETPHQTYTALLIDNPAQIMLEASARQPEETLICSDDPFMGSWASEKAHLFHDYDWVLNHVESL